MKKILMLIISSVLVSFILVGCKKEKVVIENLMAKEVYYNPEGDYETVVSATNLKELSKKEVSIYYVTMEDATRVAKKATIKKVNEDKEGFNVSFKVEEDLEPSSFRLSVNEESTTIPVVLNEARLVSHNALNMHDLDQRLTLNLEGAKLINNLKPSDVVLEGRMKNLVVTDVISEANKVTLDLKGQVLENDSLNNLVNGFVTLNNLKLDNEITSLNTQVEIKNDDLHLVNDSLTFKDGILSFDVELSKHLVKDDLTLEMLSISSDALITDFRVNDNKLTLKVAVSKANDLKSALDIIRNQELKIGDLKLKLDLTPVGFYPVFDYLEALEKDFKVTLKLLALNGKFGDVSKEDIILGNELAAGKVLSVKKENDEVLLVDLSLPLLNQTEDTFIRTGMVTVKGKALKNNYPAVAMDASYEREYSLDSLGKDNIYGQINAYADKLSGLHSPYLYKALDEAKGVSLETGNLILSILSLTGLVKTQDMLLQEQLRAFYDDVMVELTKQTRLLKQINLNVDISRFDTFNQTLNSLTNQTQLVVNYIKDNAKANNITLPNENTTEEDMQIFIKALRANGIIQGDRYYNLIFRLDELFFEVASQINEKFSLTSPFTIYDSITSQIYNFSTSSINSKLSYAATLSNAIYSSYGTLRFLNECKSRPSKFEEPKAMFAEAMESIENYYKGIKAKQKEYLDPTKKTPLYINTYDEEVYNYLYSNHEARPNFIVSKNIHHYDGKTMEFYIGNTRTLKAKAYDFLERMGDRNLKEELDLAMIYYSDPVMENGKVKYDQYGCPVMKEVEPFALAMCDDENSSLTPYFLNFYDNKLIKEKTLLGAKIHYDPYWQELITKPNRSFLTTRIQHSYK